MQAVFPEFTEVLAENKKIPLIFLSDSVNMKRGYHLGPLFLLR